MQTVLVGAFILECIILIILTIKKKMSRLFILCTIIVAGACIWLFVSDPMGPGIFRADRAGGASVDNMQDVRTAMEEGRLEDAYRLMQENYAGKSVQYDIILSEMYARNVNLRTLNDSDPEYDRLLLEMTEKQMDMDKAAQSPEPALEAEESGKEGGEEKGTASSQSANGPEKAGIESIRADKEYRAAEAGFQNAKAAISAEACKRGLRYLETADLLDKDHNIALQFQIARLSYLSGQIDRARQALDVVFAKGDGDGNRLLGQETSKLKDSCKNYEEDPEEAYGAFHDSYLQLKQSLYGGIFPNNREDLTLSEASSQGGGELAGRGESRVGGNWHYLNDPAFEAFLFRYFVGPDVRISAEEAADVVEADLQVNEEVKRPAMDLEGRQRADFFREKGEPAE
ncbi:MAG: hypothetical protein K5989_09025 [Lachnospiraceae bacterium]|nr:hypothetical protein [Lachnospiraceae bacterium]